ncbi:hypothetical protein AbraCBS73388_001580 [Aspergillus brasiliensis]|uniref:Uncharacterized protein n=1 Tax=Aspergillus brasiliensis TaxID=319629 RepID=A0A9W5YXV3_9EURO|nr:hypothetical protein AbraCBS73388_001580 [Aspergillus brasiliensis]
MRLAGICIDSLRRHGATVASAYSSSKVVILMLPLVLGNFLVGMDVSSLDQMCGLLFLAFRWYTPEFPRMPSSFDGFTRTIEVISNNDNQLSMNKLVDTPGIC